MKTKLFDLKYVHEFWDDDIDGNSYFNEQSRKELDVQASGMSIDSLMQSIEKLFYMGVDITAPTEIRNQMPSIKVLYNNYDDDCQFIKPEGGLNKYVYYDPNLAPKVAYINGATIEYYDDDDENKGWHTVSQPLWDDNTLYRIKGEDEKPKLQWDALKIGDVITNGTGVLEMVTCIDTTIRSNAHIYAMGRWITDTELETFYKV